MSEQEYTVPMIRAHHPDAFRNGHWAEIVATIEHEERECWLVRWPDDVTDFWPVDDPVAEYEFRNAERFLPTPECEGKR